MILNSEWGTIERFYFALCNDGHTWKCSKMALKPFCNQTLQLVYRKHKYYGIYDIVLETSTWSSPDIIYVKYKTLFSNNVDNFLFISTMSIIVLLWYFLLLFVGFLAAMWYNMAMVVIFNISDMRKTICNITISEINV